MLTRFKESPAPESIPPGGEDKVMHMSLEIGGTRLMGSDGHCQGKASFAGVSLSLTVADEAEAEKAFAALADGGDVQMPLAKTFFTPRFRSEEHTSELQSLMRISYAVFCLNNNNNRHMIQQYH